VVLGPDLPGRLRRGEAAGGRGRTQAEVRANLREIRDRVEAGAPVKDAATTVGAWLEDWTTKALPASDRKQATIDLYATVARSHLAPKLGKLPLDRLRPSDVEALVLAKRRAGLSASTVRTIYTVLRAALDVAVRDGLIQRSPATVVKRPAVERKDARYLSAQQAEALLEVIRGDRLEALYRLMLATGLRRGEALALHWRDVDLDAAVLRWRLRCVRKVSTAGTGSGTVRRDFSVFGSPSSSPADVRDSVHRTRSTAASRSTSRQCRASASPRRRPVASISR
jgi:integrase